MKVIWGSVSWRLIIIKLSFPRLVWEGSPFPLDTGKWPRSNAIKRLLGTSLNVSYLSPLIAHWLQAATWPQGEAVGCWLLCFGEQHLLHHTIFRSPTLSKNKYKSFRHLLPSPSVYSSKAHTRIWVPWQREWIFLYLIYFCVSRNKYSFDLSHCG